MAQFRGTIQGARGPASRLGTKRSGLEVEACSWEGKCVVTLTHDDKLGCDVCEVWLRPHYGQGESRLLYRGPVSGAPAMAQAA